MLTPFSYGFTSKLPCNSGLVSSGKVMVSLEI